MGGRSADANLPKLDTVVSVVKMVEVEYQSLPFLVEFCAHGAFVKWKVSIKNHTK